MLKRKNNSLYKKIKKKDTNSMDVIHEDTECSHKLWVKRCSICRHVLETNVKNDSTCRGTSVLYSPLKDIVTDYKVSIKLLENSVKYETHLYWRKNTDTDMVTLRMYKNVTLNHAEVVPAFTLQELIKYCQKKDIMLHNVYSSPNKLAKYILSVI